MGPEGGPRSCGATSSYKNWLQQQIKTNGLPFERVPQDPRIRLPFETADLPVVRELDEMLKKTDAERRALKRKLTQATSLQLETQEQEVDKERELRRKIGDCLKVGDKEMCLRRKEKDQAAGEKELRERLKIQHEELLGERSRREAAEAKENQALDRLAFERQDRGSKREKARAIVAELRDRIARKDSRHQELVTRVEQQVEAAEEAMKYWKDRHDKVVWLANRSLGHLPQSLRASEEVISPFITQSEIYDFVKECQMVYDDLANAIIP
ncbi:hypothetical protein CR513_53767, partial [Mucuna pruriens]